MLLGLAVCLSLFGDLSLYAVLVTQLDVVGLSLGAVGVMLGVNRLIRIPSNPLAGVLLDHWGRRRLFILGMLLGVVSTASYGLVRGFWPFLAGRLTWGIAWTLINVGGMAIVLDVSTRANRGRLSGLYNTWVQIGLAVGPLVGGLLVSSMGFRPAMLVCAGLTAAGFAIVLVALPETAQLSGREIRLEAGSALSLPRQLTRAWQSSGALLAADRGLMTAAWLLLITQFASIGIVLSTVSLLLQQRFGESLDLGSLALGVGSASGILLGLRSALASVTGPLAGRLSDRHSGRRPVIAGALALGILGFGTLFVARSLEVIVLGVALGALSDGAALAALTAYMGDLTPPGRQGIAMGAFATAGDIGTTAGPFLAFALASTVDLRWIYLLCTLAFLVGLWLIWRV